MAATGDAICAGLISPGLYHHTKSRSYYALSGGQGLTSSGVGEMIPQSPGRLRHLLPPTLTWPGSSLPCLCKAAPRQDGPYPGHPDVQRAKSLPETEQGFDPTGKAVTGANVFGDKSPHLCSCLSLKDTPGECEQLLGRRWLSKLEKNGSFGRGVLAPNLESLCHIKTPKLQPELTKNLPGPPWPSWALRPDDRGWEIRDTRAGSRCPWTPSVHS